EKGVTKFNKTFPRRVSVSCNSGIQIQYNLSRIDGWCKEHDLADGSRHLQRLAQAVRLLQFQKATVADVDSMLEICHLLNASQVKQLMSNYAPTDYETAVNSELIKAIAERARSDEPVMLDARSVEEDAAGWKNARNAREVESIDRHVPAWVAESVPKTNVVVGLVAKNE
ncbi:MAG: DIL domain-containing protein, partial [Olpidium bornovanus]